MPDALETALLELRETPTAEFAADLDARVAAGFGATPGRRGAPPQPPRKPKRRLPGWLFPAGGFAVAAALCVLVVAGISTSDMDDSSGGSGGGSAASSADQTMEQAQGSSGGSTAAPSRSLPAPSGAATPGRNRKVERTAALTLTTPADEVERAAASVSDVAGRQGGYVEASTVDAERGDGSGDFVLRIPVDRLDAAMAALARIGDVTQRRQTTQDITASFNVARAALGEARAERTSLLKRLADADTDAETTSLRARLRDANARIGAAQVALRQVDRRAAYARVDVALRAGSGAAADADADEGSGWGVGAAWDDARRVLEVAAGVAVLALAVLAPLALLALLGAGGRRAAVSRARNRALDSA